MIESENSALLCSFDVTCCHLKCLILWRPRFASFHILLLLGVWNGMTFLCKCNYVLDNDSHCLLTMCRIEDLRIPFERYGVIKDVYLPKDYYTG
jgi:hypothetical protein